MANLTYEQFEQRLLNRHQNAATAALSTVGDAVAFVGLIAACLTRDRRWAARGLWAGLASASIAHLLQPGTLVDEYAAILRHPRWAARAEWQRVRGSRVGD